MFCESLHTSQDALCNSMKPIQDKAVHILIFVNKAIYLREQAKVDGFSIAFLDTSRSGSRQDQLPRRKLESVESVMEAAEHNCTESESNSICKT